MESTAVIATVLKKMPIRPAITMMEIDLYTARVFAAVDPIVVIGMRSDVKQNLIQKDQIVQLDHPVKSHHVLPILLMEVIAACT
jgi:hypothetical protein